MLQFIFTGLQQDLNWLSIINTLGFPIAVALGLFLFLFRYVWPWMTQTMAQHMDENRKKSEEYATNLIALNERFASLIREIKAESKERDQYQRQETLRREAEYRELLQQQAQQGINTLETINANTLAMQSLGTAVDKLRDAAQLEERLAELEKARKNQ